MIIEYRTTVSGMKVENEMRPELDRNHLQIQRNVTG